MDVTYIRTGHFVFPPLPDEPVSLARLEEAITGAGYEILVPGHMGRVAFEFTADDPGDWFFHCHNLYHLESGMARVFRYV